MSSAFRILVLVALVTCLPAANSRGRGWSEEEPANCPHVNNKTHVCSTLESSESKCYTIKCCSDFEDYEYYEDYHGGEYDDYSDDDDNGDENGGIGGRHRRGDDGVQSGGHGEGHSEGYDDENSREHDDGDDGGHGGGHSEGHSGGQYGCRLCFSVRTCTVYKCFTSCCDGYQKDYTGTCSNSTGALECENGGTLEYNNRKGYFCKCPSGFRGTKCEIPKCRCKNGGECGVKDGQPHCNCTAGYYGDRCQISNCSMDCRNGGVCYKSDGNEFCLCPDNYIGMLCGQYYVNPDACPTSVPTNDTCESQCTKNKHCKGDHVCCKEGCSSVCRQPKAELCKYEGHIYTINATHSPDPCTNCTCMLSGDMICYSISCAVPQCLHGEPEALPGDCCPTCPDKPDLPMIYNCPTQVVRLNTSYYTDIALLNEDSTKIRAYDADGNKLQVYYKPENVHHCHCAPSIGSETTVQAYATDVNDHLVTCSFRVIVTDIYKPRFIYCPQNMHVPANEVVQWEEPTYEDNVGIKTILGPDRRSGEIFPVGTHTVAYHIWDHDSSMASCYFNVTVARDPPRMYNCPVEVLRLNTSYYYDYALLNTHTTRIRAYDYEGSQLTVQYQPTTAAHCKCSNSETAAVDIQVTATDDYNNTVKCLLQVIVKDIYKPEFTYCPGNIYVSENDKVEWREPTYKDNVGIAATSTSERHYGEIYPVGNHTVYYNILDFDGNSASCRVNISVSKDKPIAPKITKCPTQVLHLNTSYNTNKTVLNEQATSIKAYDSDGNTLQVTYQPPRVQHCYCYDSHRTETTVTAYAADGEGNVETCTFNITVRDIYTPIIMNCPQSLVVSEGEKAVWREPTFEDNVAVAGSSALDRQNNTIFPVGNYTVSYDVWDYDSNTARCHFNVSVIKAKCTLWCYNGGSCERSGTNQFCRCTTNYIGRNCERKYTDPNTCPAPEPSTRDTCKSDCTGNSQCVGDAVCCKEGCNSVCRQPEPVYCALDGEQYAVNATYSPDPCTNCTCSSTGEMMCYSMSCSLPICPFGRRPVSDPSHCCLICPVKPKPLPIINCPSQPVRVITGRYTNATLLDDVNTKVEAYDAYNYRLQVNYRPPVVHHCKCHEPSHTTTVVEAYAADLHGNIVTCSFQVIVKDMFPPTLKSCPEDIYVIEEEVVEWFEPTYADNVGVADTSCSSDQNGMVFPVGVHIVTYDIWDYDRNTATCIFRVSVTADDTAIEDISPGLRARYQTNTLHVILPPVGGAIFLGVLVLLLLFCCRRKMCASGSKTKLDEHKVNGQKQVNTEHIYSDIGDIGNALPYKKQRPSSSLSRSTSSSMHDVTSRALSYENNMYGLPREIGIRPPAYSPYPHSPPAYSISGGSIKDVTYMSMPVPSYTNPDYQTLGVHSLSKPSRSGRSGSTSRSGRSGSTSRSVRSGSTSRSVMSNSGSSTRSSNFSSIA